MIPVRRLREERDTIIELLKVKNFDATSIIDQVLQLDDKRKNIQKELDDILAQSNSISNEVAKLYREGKGNEAEAKKQESANLKTLISTKTEELKNIESQLELTIVQLPNVPHTSVPKGKTPEENIIVREGGTKPTLPAGSVPHWDLCKKYDIIDFDLGVKLTGAGFPVFKNKGAKLERALIQFFLQEATTQGYIEYSPPLMVNEASAFATGQLPDKEGQMYQNADGFYMIPTSEVPLTNIYRDTITQEPNLPIKMTAYSPCFRREAGSYGKDVRGLNRLHQFDKVEIVQLIQPEKSYETLELMVKHVENLLNLLELPYRVLLLCGGDMSFTSALTYDLEVYSSAQEKWLEVSSVSNFEDYQANRLKARYKNADGKINLLHTLNGSALALPRIVAALLENNQTEKGIKIPKALVPYTGFEWID